MAFMVALGEVLAYAISGLYTRLSMTFFIMLIIGLIASCIIAVFLCCKYVETDKRRALIVLGIAFLCGVIRMSGDDLTLRHKRELDAICDTNEKVDYEAIITGIEDKGERIVIQCDELLVYVDAVKCPPIRIGNRIRVNAKINSMNGARNPGEYDFRLYYRGMNITHRCFANSVEVVEGRVDKVKDLVYRVRSKMLSNIQSVYEPNDEGMLRAILLGDRSRMDDDVYDLYKKNGIAHLLAISGLHIGIIGMSFYNLLHRRIKLSPAISGGIASGFLCVYALLTGLGVSTVRAVIMLLLTFLAGALGRKSDMLNSAGLAALVILLIRPYQIFSCGFLLSFACVIAIGGPAKMIMTELDIKNSLLQSFVLSLCVQFVSLPITAYFFFEIPLYGCLLNLIVIPLMTYVVWSGLGAMLLCFVSIPASRLVAGSGHYILKLYELLGSMTSKLPGYSLVVGRPQLWQVVVYYLFFFAVLYWCQLKRMLQNLPFWTLVREMVSSLMQGRES